MNQRYYVYRAAAAVCWLTAQSVVNAYASWCAPSTDVFHSAPLDSTPFDSTPFENTPVPSGRDIWGRSLTLRCLPCPYCCHQTGKTRQDSCTARRVVETPGACEEKTKLSLAWVTAWATMPSHLARLLAACGVSNRRVLRAWASGLGPRALEALRRFGSGDCGGVGKLGRPWVSLPCAAQQQFGQLGGRLGEGQ